ncbi:MAG: hypothetical protein MUO72_09645 [Bacteroidales bacterium]|nr:hypothetical protein [Bacteroidales bacterium]
MFLDDKLYNQVKQFKIEKPEDFKILVNSLFRICEDHWKPKLDLKGTYKEAKQILDQTFNAWNLFIKKLEKENWYLIDILKEEGDYKQTYLNNKKCKEIYEKGK